MLYCDETAEVFFFMCPELRPVLTLLSSTSSELEDPVLDPAFVWTLELYHDDEPLVRGTVLLV